MIDFFSETDNLTNDCVKVKHNDRIQNIQNITQSYLELMNGPSQDTVPDIIDSGPMCITDLFQYKYLAYFNPK